MCRCICNLSVESSIVLRIRSEFYLHTSVCLSHMRYSSRNLSHPFKGEEKDSEEEVGITQPLPLTPCLPSLSPMFPQCGQKHGGHGYSQHGLSPLSYQINLEFAQITLVLLYIYINIERGNHTFYFTSCFRHSACLSVLAFVFVPVPV